MAADSDQSKNSSGIASGAKLDELLRSIEGGKAPEWIMSPQNFEEFLVARRWNLVRFIADIKRLAPQKAKKYAQGIWSLHREKISEERTIDFLAACLADRQAASVSSQDTEKFFVWFNDQDKCFKDIYTALCTSVDDNGETRWISGTTLLLDQLRS